MSEINLPGKTDWESQQYRKDHGHRVAAAQAYRYLARQIEDDESYPLPPGSEAVITLAAAAMQDANAARTARIEAYAAQRLVIIRSAASETHTAIMGSRA
jgi:hypothetical protein